MKEQRKGSEGAMKGSEGARKGSDQGNHTCSRNSFVDAIVAIEEYEDDLSCCSCALCLKTNNEMQ